MQLAQFTTQPKLFLEKVSFPQIPQDKLKIEGLGFTAGEKVALFQPKWLFYNIKNIKEKTFDMFKTCKMQVEMKLTLGNSAYSDVKDMNFSATTNNGILYCFVYHLNLNLL